MKPQELKGIDESKMATLTKNLINCKITYIFN